MKEFTTAVQHAEQEDAGTKYDLEFGIDGVMCRARRPKDGQLAVLMATTGRHSSMNERIAGIINFFIAVLDEPSHTYVVGRLLDSEDEFGLEQVEQVMSWMVEEWSGRPTEAPSVSTQSPPSTGRSSTENTPQLI
jgi:hypothetical protein